MGHIDFPPLEPQETYEENDDNLNIPNSITQIQNTLKELGNILKDKETTEIKDIEPLPLND